MCSRENIFNDIYSDKLLIFFPESFTYKTSDRSGTLIFGQMHHTICKMIKNDKKNKVMKKKKNNNSESSKFPNR